MPRRCRMHSSSPSLFNTSIHPYANTRTPYINLSLTVLKRGYRSAARPRGPQGLSRDRPWPGRRPWPSMWGLTGARMPTPLSRSPLSDRRHTWTNPFQTYILNMYLSSIFLFPCRDASAHRYMYIHAYIHIKLTNLLYVGRCLPFRIGALPTQLLAWHPSPTPLTVMFPFPSNRPISPPLPAPLAPSCLHNS